MAKTETVQFIADGSFDFVGGVNSDVVTTVQSPLNTNGLKRNCLAWLNNATTRGGTILQRTGWQPVVKVVPTGSRWQGKYMYEPDGANPYIICSISGHIYKVLVEAPFTVTDLSAAFGLFNPPNAEIAFFAQGEQFLVIQAGDFFTPGVPTPGTTDSAGHTLPLFWDGTTLRRSKGITTATPTGPGQNELPAATSMWYHAQRIWYARARTVTAGDLVGSTFSGTAAYNYRDSILNVTENPVALGGDGFSIPTNSGNIRALREEVNLNESIAQSRLLIWTRKSVFALSVPETRADWIAATNSNQPKIVPVQRVNGTVSDRSVVAVNGDWFYQSFEPGIRTLISGVRYYQQWGNTPISQNEKRALDVNNRALMRFSGGIEFDNRVLELVLPQIAGDGVNIIHKAILPLDFDTVTNLTEQSPIPAWEGAWDGLDFLELSTGDFGGLPRAFAAVISELDGSINIWELTTSSRRENGDNRVTWSPEFPAFNWALHGLEFKLKQLKGGELWVDKISGTVNMTVYYRSDADPCWRLWFATELCTERCEDEAVTTAYPCTPFREGYRWPVVFPEPPRPECDSMGIRPTTVGYQFQTKILIKGWCRIRGIILYALSHTEPQYHGVACPPATTPQGMAKLPNPFG